MTALLTIIGHDPADRLNLVDADITAAGGVPIKKCNDCAMSKVLVSAPLRLPNGALVPVAGFSADPAVRPAEMYIISFNLLLEAKNFVANKLGDDGAAKRVVVLLDLEAAVDYAPVVAANPSLCALVVLGWPPSAPLNLDAALFAGAGVLGQGVCNDCTMSVPLVRSTTWSGPGLAPMATQPGMQISANTVEAYVLLFSARATAINYAQDALMTGPLEGKTVLLLQ